MHPKTQEIVQVTDEADARASGLVPIPNDQVELVRGMNRRERRRWQAQQRCAERRARKERGR